MNTLPYFDLVHPMGITSMEVDVVCDNTTPNNEHDFTLEQRVALMEQVFPEKGRLRWDFPDPETGKTIIAGASCPTKKRLSYVFSVNFCGEQELNRILLVKLSAEGKILTYFPITEKRTPGGGWGSSTANGDKDLFNEKSLDLQSEREQAMAHVTELFKSAVGSGVCRDSSNMDPIIGRGP
ncbi:MAG: hypothetical protein AB8F34_10135 [Akkermansiaceae bacterium]